MKKKKYAALENKPLMRAMLDIRRSSAASKHTLKSKKGTRLSRKTAAIKDQA